MSRIASTFFLAFSILAVTGAPATWADTHDAMLRVRTPFQVHGLAFFGTRASVRIFSEDSPDQQMVATLKGRYDRKGWTLLGPDNVPISSTFELVVPLTSVATPIHFVAVGPYGTTEEGVVLVIDPNFTPSSEASGEIPAVGSSFGVGVGISSISYTQTGLQSFSEVALTPKFSYQRALNSQWDIGANAFATAIPFSTSVSGLSAKFIGLNARAGYTISSIPKPWTLSVAGGFYYTTMVSSGADFGYHNMFGPQIFPSLRRSLSARNMIGTYIKYSPVAEIGAFGFASHEFATGLSFTHLLGGRRSFSLTFDYSNITANVSSAQANASSATLGCVYGF